MSMPPPPAGPPPYGQSPGQPLSSSEERTWSLASHVGTFVAAWFAMGFLCPLVIWLMYRDRSEFVRRHALESLNFQISLLIYGAIAFVLAFVTIGLGLIIIIPVGIAFVIFALVVIIMATIAAADGREYRYPLSIRLVR